MHSRLDRKTVRAASWVQPPYCSPRRAAAAGAGMARLIRAAPAISGSTPGIRRISAQAAYDYLAGKKVKKNITVEVTLITRDNLDEFDVDGWQ